MSGVTIVISIAIGFLCGYTYDSMFNRNFRLKETINTHYQNKAIQKHFSCQPNEYTFFFEENDDFYILTFKNEERRIKFSTKKPYNIVYDQVLDYVG